MKMTTVNVNGIQIRLEDTPELRTEMQVRAMLHVVPDQIRKGGYQSAIGWKETCREALKALNMAQGAKRTAAIGRVHIALTAMGG